MERLYLSWWCDFVQPPDAKRTNRHTLEFEVGTSPMSNKNEVCESCLHSRYKDLRALRGSSIRGSISCARARAVIRSIPPPLT
jgi:hypothetical protein